MNDINMLGKLSTNEYKLFMKLYREAVLIVSKLPKNYRHFGDTIIDCLDNYFKALDMVKQGYPKEYPTAYLNLIQIKFRFCIQEGLISTGQYGVLCLILTDLPELSN